MDDQSLMFLNLDDDLINIRDLVMVSRCVGGALLRLRSHDKPVLVETPYDEVMKSFNRAIDYLNGDFDAELESP